MVLSATASSGLPVAFRVVSGPAVVSGSRLTVTGTGAIVVRASQQGNSNYEPADDVDQSFFAGGYAINLVTTPPGLTITVDGAVLATPTMVVWMPGSTHRLAVSPMQSGIASSYRFIGWADGGPAERTVTASADNVTYTAAFAAQHLLSVNVTPAGSGTVVRTPDSPTGFYDAGTEVTLEAVPGPQNHFAGFSGAVVSTNRVAKIVITRTVFVTAEFAGGPALTSLLDAAGFRAAPLAPGAIFALFGSALAEPALTITDQTGAGKPASLLYTSATQVNFIVPEGLTPGPVTLKLTNSAGTATLETTLAATSPGLFTSNGNGSGAAAGHVIRVKADGTQEHAPLASCGATPGSCVPTAIDFGAETDQIYISLYGTGFRSGSRDTVQVSIGGTPVPVEYVGPQPDTPGLDQLNVKLPRSLAGMGEVDLVLTVDGKPSNTVRIKL